MAGESQKPTEPKVLIIEDVPAFQNNAAQISGCGRVWITNNMEDAREMFESFKPDFVISDMNFFRSPDDLRVPTPKTSYLPAEVAQMCHSTGVGLAFVSGGNEVDVYLLGPEEIGITKDSGFAYKEDIEFQTKNKTTEIWQFALNRLKEAHGWKEKAKEQESTPKPEPKPAAEIERKKTFAQGERLISLPIREQMKIDYVACLLRLKKAGKISRESLKRNLKSRWKR